MRWARAAVFLDKDGTLVHDVPYNVDPRRLTFTAGAAEGLRALQAAGFGLVIVSNQSGVGRGLISMAAVEALGQALCTRLAEDGVRIDGFYYCPHHPATGCACRKPRPGLLRRAAAELGVCLPASWMVGDILDDVEAGHRAGCRTILFASGGETVWRRGPLRMPHAVATSLPQVARIILNQPTQSGR